MAVLGPFEVGSGILNFLSPNYTPVAGRAGPADWTYGGGGNYIRPWTSFSQRLVEANNSLGPFAMRLGGNITGRLVISTQSESFGQLGYCDQDWWNANDGNTGYPSKAEWWNSVVKTVVQARDMNSVGHPVIHVEVAYFDPTDPAERYNPPSWWDNFASSMNGLIPNNIGWLTGNPFPTPPNDTPGTPPVSDMASAAASWAANLVSNFGSAVESAYQSAVGQATNSFEFVSNILDGIEAGQLGVNNHIDHNRTPPDENGNFDHIPGETNTNPRDLIMRNGLQQNYAVNLGTGSNLPTADGDVTTPNGTDSTALHYAIVTQMGEAQANWGIANNGKAATAFYIHGRTIYNLQNSVSADFPDGNPAAAPNPTIDNQGNLRIYDTYEFANSNFDAVADFIAGPDQAAATELRAFFDTAPGYHTVPSLSDAGSVRETNEGGTPGSGTNISSLQNTYTGVVVTPHNLNQSNPTLYNNLKNKGYFNHVDPSLLP